jgi:hypothetical protein
MTLTEGKNLIRKVNYLEFNLVVFKQILSKVPLIGIAQELLTCS